MDLASDLTLAILLVALIVSAVVLGAAETSLLRVRQVRVELLAEEGNRRARRLVALLHDLPRVLNSVLLAVLLVQIGAATVAGVLAQQWFGNLGVTIGSVVLTAVLFVYGEAIPKTYAVRYPLPTALMLAWPVWALATMLRPLVSILVTIADLQAPGTGIASPVAVSEAELRALAAEAEEAGEIERTDRELIERAFRLGDRHVGEIIVPRTDIVGVPAEAGVAEALEIAISSGHRRLPVYAGSLDEIVGVVRLRDLAGAVAAGAPATVRDMAGEVLVAPESKRVVDLLGEMQAQALHLAVVVDEHGGTAGMVTIEDVVEQLVGDVADEGEVVQPDIRKVGTATWRVIGTCDLIDLEERLGVDLPHGDWTTAAGLVIGLAGHIPAPGEEFEDAGLRFRVLDATDRRVKLLEVERA